MAHSVLTPIGAVTRGLAAGAAATGAMTAAQTAYYKATDTESSSTPGEVGRRVVEGVFLRPVSEEQVSGSLTTGMHWLYGTVWGLPYGILAGSRSMRSILAEALGLAAGLWTASRAGMSAMQLAPPPWQDPPKMLAMDLGFHFVYGAAAAVTFRVLSPTSTGEQGK